MAKQKAFVVDSASVPSTIKTVDWSVANGAAFAHQLQNAAKNITQTLVVIVENMQQAESLVQDLAFFDHHAVLFPDTETLPYDAFSPQLNIISARLSALARLRQRSIDTLVVTMPTLMQRIAPPRFLDGHSLLLKPNDHVDREAWRLGLEASGYQHVKQVMEPGEFTIRGGIIDLFPMGIASPIRIELFDDEVETIRTFDPETQRTLETLPELSILPAREFEMSKIALERFEKKFKETFEVDTTKCALYQEIMQGNLPAGIENYLPLFFDKTATLFDYLTEHTTFVLYPELFKSGEQFQKLIDSRYERYRHDVEKPLLSPMRLYLNVLGLEELLSQRPKIQVTFTHEAPAITQINQVPEWLAQHKDNALIITTETHGRREMLLERLKSLALSPKIADDFVTFAKNPAPFAVMVGALSEGFRYDHQFAIVTENGLLGVPMQTRRKKQQKTVDVKSMLTSIDHLKEGDPIVHLKHGVGRYVGLDNIDDNELLVIEYKGNGRLYIPITDLNDLSLYTGGSKESAPWHKLGSDQWEKICKKASEKIHDTAAELLDIYSRRELQKAHGMAIVPEYDDFAKSFPFQTTPDQQRAIDDVLSDLTVGKMDRIICGDVGFGKTEVAMRAAFMAVMNGYQVAVLAPTTLLAEQHVQDFMDRFADWPVKIAGLSRFRSTKETKQTLALLAEGQVDIVIGTHKILSKDVHFKNLGLIVIDEEHRFGVKHKEKLKSLRTEVNLLTMTATPIPRTLNMGLSGLRELSIIATPPVERIAVKTFVNQWNDELMVEAMNRELKRGGQLYILHNEVDTIELMQATIERLMPGITIGIAHGQMKEAELEQVMLDFYHHRIQVLLCTTIVESGIDVPNANTMIINRADKLGLAQLHQLRGRVGRSHQRAYCYLIVPPAREMTKDAIKRIEALTETETLGAGFMIANHDLEIRGAGELLGESQSGQITEMGFSLYMELLTRAVEAIKRGETLDVNQPFKQGMEVALGLPALIPEDYIMDIPTRLSLYKRIASAEDMSALNDIHIEMIDRFGLLPEQAKRLFKIAEIKLKAAPLNLEKIEANNEGIRIVFGAKPNINLRTLVDLIQQKPDFYQLQGQEVLRYRFPLEEEALRIETVLYLIGKLAP